jgi:hypothetical protein
MPTPHMNFSRDTKREALERQTFRCASCGRPIVAIEDTEQTGAAGHHVIPHKMGGPITVDNCVVICRACHLNSHQGGRWGDVSIYEDITNPPTPRMIAKIAALYPYYRG